MPVEVEFAAVNLVYVVSISKEKREIFEQKLIAFSKDLYKPSVLRFVSRLRLQSTIPRGSTLVFCNVLLEKFTQRHFLLLSIEAFLLSTLIILLFIKKLCIFLIVQRRFRLCCLCLKSTVCFNNLFLYQ